MKFNGNLDAMELTPDLNSLTGDLLGQLLSTTVSAQNSTLLNALGANLKFIDNEQNQPERIESGRDFQGRKSERETV